MSIFDTSKRKASFINSLGLKLWLYFVCFAIAILMLIWGLQIYMLNYSYESMKIKQAQDYANYVISEYSHHGMSDAFFNNIRRSLKENDMSLVFIDTDGTMLIMGSSEAGSHFDYYAELSKLDSEIEQSGSSITSGFVQRDPAFVSSTKTYSYATYLDAEKTTKMFLFTPIYPVASTIVILRKQLIIISILALIAAFGLAIIVSRRVSVPLKKITASAARLADGEFGVEFKGEHYSEIIHLGETLDYTSKELAKTDELHKDLIANVSHDLRTPLTMIKSYAEMIRDLSGDNPKKRKAHLQVIIDETDRLNVLVNDLFILSKFQAGTEPLSKTDFNLTESISELVATYKILEETEDYTIDFNADEAFFVNADRNRIQQVAGNLINNAVKYCGENRHITVSLKRETKAGPDPDNHRRGFAGKRQQSAPSDMVVFSCRDYGPGIPSEDLEKIWKRYYKSSSTYSRSGGSGLGLSIVSEILKRHEADYGVNSIEGMGSTFWFKLPILDNVECPPDLAESKKCPPDLAE